MVDLFFFQEMCSSSLTQWNSLITLKHKVLNVLNIMKSRQFSFIKALELFSFFKCSEELVQEPVQLFVIKFHEFFSSEHKF